MSEAARPLSRRSLDQHLDDFERALVRQQKSPATIRSYLWALQDLVRFLEGTGVRDLEQLQGEHLERWQDALIQRGLKPWSRSLAVVAARQWLLWAADHDLVDWRLTRRLERVRKPRLAPKPIPPADLERIKAYLAPMRPRMALRDLRTRALFFYLLATGARISEALQVKRSELEDAIVIQKGGTEKVLRIPPSCAHYLEDYLDARRRRDDNPWLWVSHDTNREPRRLTANSALICWQHVARKAGVKPFTTHQIRHTCASELLEAGVPELVIADHLGHHGVGTLHVYGQVREAQRQQVRDVAERLVSPPAGMLRPLPRLRRK